MAKATKHSMRQWMALLATVFVVGGVALVVSLQPKAGGGLVNDDVETDIALSGRVVVYAREEMIHVIDADTGETLRECAIAGGAQIFHVTREGILIGTPTGGWVRIGFDCVVSDTVLASGVPNAGGHQTARVNDPDDAGVINLVMEAKTGSEETDWVKEIPLRHENGRPFREPQVVGWIDDAAVALVALRGDVRYVVLVDETGDVQTLAPLPELAEGFSVGGTSVWYVTATPGEGIEFGPSGPSAIHRILWPGRGPDVARVGTDMVVAQEPVALIGSLHVNADGRYAYTAGGRLMLGYEKALVDAGTGSFLGWTDDGRLIALEAENRVVFKTIAGETENTTVQLDSGIVDPRHEGYLQAWSVLLEPTAPLE